jgi:hypothetical protein
MAKSTANTRKLRIACDRCYDLKERCVRECITASCVRCERLRLHCSTDRPVRPSGRRPQHGKRTVSQRSSTLLNRSEPASNDVSTKLRYVPDYDLCAEEKELLMFLLGQPERVQSLVVLRSFAIIEQQTLAALLPFALPILKHAYLACAVWLKSLQYGTDEEVARNTGVLFASPAMSTLRTLSVTTEQDATLCLALGNTLALFVYSGIGYGVADICHYCISAVSTIVTSTPPSLPLESWKSFLELLEVMECLIHRRSPTLRAPQQLQERVDRKLGLCLPLLPHYQDLCIVSHSLSNETDASCIARIHAQLDKIHTAVDEWIPSHARQILDHFDSTELVHLLAQAKVYRLAALLVAHRLRHDFGSEDDKAGVWSKEVMRELELTKHMTKQPLRFVTLPFIVAAIEVRGTEARVSTLQAVKDYVDGFAPVIQ